MRLALIILITPNLTFFFKGVVRQVMYRWGIAWSSVLNGSDEQMMTRMLILLLCWVACFKNSWNWRLESTILLGEKERRGLKERWEDMHFHTKSEDTDWVLVPEPPLVRYK